MAVTKIWAVHKDVGSSVSYIENPDKTYDLTENLNSDLEETIGYVLESTKTENGRLLYGLNCDPYKAEEEFLQVKEKYEKLDGVQAYHGYISFPKDDRLSPNDALSIGKKVAEEMWGDDYQAVLAVHTNTDILHIHFLVNSVSRLTGRKARDNAKSYYRLRAITDRICKEYGLTVIENSLSKERKTNMEIIEDILEANLSAQDVPGVQRLLKEKGYRILKKDHIKTPDGRILDVKDLDERLSVQGNEQSGRSEMAVNKPEEARKDERDRTKSLRQDKRLLEQSGPFSRI